MKITKDTDNVTMVAADTEADTDSKDREIGLVIHYVFPQQRKALCGVRHPRLVTYRGGPKVNCIPCAAKIAAIRGIGRR